MEKKRLELNNETKRMIRRAAGRRFSLQLEKLIQQKKVHEENLKITDEYYQIVKGKMKEVQKELANVFEGFRVSSICYFYSLFNVSASSFTLLLIIRARLFFSLWANLALQHCRGSSTVTVLEGIKCVPVYTVNMVLIEVTYITDELGCS